MTPRRQTNRCENSFECDPDEFATSFNDVDDCVQYIQYFVDYFADDYGADCADAFVELLECAA